MTRPPAAPPVSPAPWAATAWLGFVVLVAAVLYAPALDVGYLADDVYQIALLEGVAGSRAPWALYSLYPLDPAGTAEHVARGSLPWWTVPDFRFVQVRPLSSLLLALDHAVWPRAATVHHVHSMLWLGGTLVAAHVLLRRATTPWIAATALLAYAVDETFGWTVAWLANRCAMVSATFAFAALAVHLRSVHEPSGRRRLVELSLWLLAFAAGEYALCGAAYGVAHALVGRAGPWRERLLALAPVALALAVFAALSVVLHAGVHGATSYVDPIDHPGPFVLACLDRVPRMLGEVFLAIPGESDRLLFRYEDTWLPGAIAALSSQSGATGVIDAHGRFVLLVVVAVGLPTWALARRELTAPERRAVAWTTLGSLGALVPLAAILPSTRALALAALGPAVFVASVAVAAARALRARPRTTRARLRAAALGVVTLALLGQHLVADAVWARIQIAGIRSTGRSYQRFHDGVPGALVRARHVVVLAAPGLVTGLHGAWIMHLMGRPAARTWHALTLGERRLLVRRSDARTLELSTIDQVMHDQPQETLFRPPPEGLHQGDAIDVGLFRAKVVHERPPQGPASVQFVFDRSLEHDDLVFLVSGPQGLERFTVPAVGRAVLVAPAVLPGNEPHGGR